jgi:hypothetical protein
MNHQELLSPLANRDVMERAGRTRFLYAAHGHHVECVQVTLEEFTALMTGAIGGRDPFQV